VGLRRKEILYSSDPTHNHTLMEGRSDLKLNTDQTVTADRILEVLQSQSPKEALRLVRQLETMEQKGGLKADLKADQTRLKVVALPLLPSSEIISIFQGDLRPVLEFNLNSRLKIRLVTAPAQVQDDIKKQILSTLEINNQPFVSGQIKSPVDWLKSFREKGQSNDVFTKESSVFQALTIEDQLRVQRLLQIIEQALTSSASDENMEDELMVKDETGRFKVLKEGKLVDLGFEEIDESDRSQARAIPAVEVPALPAQPLEEKKVPVRQAIAPPPPAVPKISPSFYFHTDDEKEVDRHRINLADLGPEAGTDLDVVVSQLIKDFDLKFPDEAIQTRFTSIIKSRLRDVRDLIETRNMLTRPIEVGGVGLSDKLVMEIIAQLEEESLKVHQPRPIQPKTQPVPPALPVEEKKPETITPPPPVEKVVPSPQRVAVESVSKPAPIQTKPQPIPVSPVPKRETKPEPVKTPIVDVRL